MKLRWYPMEKKILIERTTDTSPLSYSNESKRNPNALGHLAGIGAEFNKPTRNGRRYPVELWRNVMNSDDFKEGMETHTIFAETDHPSEASGRIDTSIKEVAAVLTDMEIRENEGILWVEFDILDTPQGRILKNLVDYGCLLGTSSRGLGDEIERNGETIIDPDTYSYFGHDIVVMPAVKAARQYATESAERTSMVESFNKEIENATSASELNAIKKIAEATELPDLASITEAINIKLESFENNGDNISSKLEDDLGAISQENERLKSELEKLKSRLSANNIRLSETKSLLKKSRESAGSLRKNLQESMKQVADLQSEIFDSAEQMESLTKTYESNRKNYLRKINRINDKCHEVMEELHRASDRSSKIKNHYEEESARVASDHENEIASLEAKYTSEISRLTERNSQLESQIKDLTSGKKLVETRAKSESDAMKRKIESNAKYIKDLTDSYAKARCAQEGISVTALMDVLPEKYDKDMVDKKVFELSDRKRRMRNLPFSTEPVTARLEEDLVKMSDEDRQTWEILNKTFK